MNKVKNPQKVPLTRRDGVPRLEIEKPIKYTTKLPRASKRK